MITHYYLVGVWGYESLNVRIVQTSKIHLTVYSNGTPEGEAKGLSECIENLEKQSWETVKNSMMQTTLPYAFRFDECRWLTISITPLTGNKQ